MDYTCVLSPFQYSTSKQNIEATNNFKKIKSLVSISWQYCFPSASSSYISYLSQVRVRFVQFNTRQQSVSQHFYQNLPTLPKFQTQVLNRYFVVLKLGVYARTFHKGNPTTLVIKHFCIYARCNLSTFFTQKDTLLQQNPIVFLYIYIKGILQQQL